MDSVRDGFESWMQQVKLAISTKDNYINYLKYVPDEPEKITQSFVNEFVKAHNNPSGRAFIKNYVHNYLNLWAIQIPKIRGRKGKKVYTFLTKDEVDRLINTALQGDSEDRQIALIMALMFDTASRISEVLNMAFKDIEFRDIENEDFIVRGIGKGNKEFEAYISRKTADMLVTLVRKNDVSIGESLFPRLDRKGVLYRIQKLGYDVLNKKILNHDFKRAKGGHMKRLGYPLDVRRLYLRHESYETMQPYEEMPTREKMKELIKQSFI